MTKFNYGFSFNTHSKKLNVTSGLYPVFDSLFQQIRQIMLSPECRGRIDSDKIKYLTFTFDAYRDSWGKSATITLLNSKDLSFSLSATLSWHKGDAYLQEYGPKIKLDLYFSGKFYKTNKIYLSPQFVLNIKRTLNYLCNLQEQDDPNKLTHLSNVFEEYRRRLYNWTRLIEYSRKKHESKQSKLPKLVQKLKDSQKGFILDSRSANNLEDVYIFIYHKDQPDQITCTIFYLKSGVQPEIQFVQKRPMTAIELCNAMYDLISNIHQDM